MDKKEIIERLYALRAAISLLAMQFDKYDKANRDRVQQIYLDVTNKFENILEENLYQSKGEYDHYFEFPDMSGEKNNESGRKYDSNLYSNRETNEYDAMSPKYWLRIMGQVCIYDKFKYILDRKSALIYYEKIAELIKQYRCNDFLVYGNIIMDEDDYNLWKRSFDNQPYESRIARDFIVDTVENVMDKINYDCTSFSKEYECQRARFLIRSIIGGRWLFTDEACTHFQTKLKELNEVINTIHSDTEKLRPKGLTKLFGRNPNGWLIERNEKRINLGNIAVNNLQRGIAYLEDAIPKAKALIEEKELEMEEIKAEYVLMLRAIQEEFADVLDKRDWQDVDLLIYYFESGRADNLKEALLQVDNERRTNRIVDTIKEATNRICWTSKTGFDMLNSTLQQGFAAIESRIQQQNILLARQNQLLAKQNGLIAQQNAQLSDLVSAANLSNALLAQQNESSEQLVSKMTTLERVIVG